MAKRINRKQKFYDRVPDWIWPHLTGDPEPAPKDQSYFSAKHVGLLAEVNRILLFRLTQTERGVQNVESKLLALLTLTSVLSVAVTASLAAAITLGTVAEDAKIFAGAAVILVFYVAAQLLRSLWSTVAGLTRRSYKQLSPEGMIPKDSETGDVYQTRVMNLQVNHMRWNEWVVDQKVSEMAVAHAALKNALTATFILIVLALVIASVHLV